MSVKTVLVAHFLRLSVLLTHLKILIAVFSVVHMKTILTRKNEYTDWGVKRKSHGPGQGS
jgi:hypothetical protein